MNVPISPPVDLRNLKELASHPSGHPELGSGAAGLTGAEGELSHPVVARDAGRNKSIAAALAVAGVGVMAATGVLARRTLGASAARRSRRRGLLLLGGAGLACAGLVAWQLRRWFTPTPRYEVELRAGSFEVRRYPALRLAVTTMDGPWSAALEEGFRRLAAFVFGENSSRQHVGMTAPVLGSGGEDGFKVAFVMPAEGVLPPPNDPRVLLEDVPERRVAVLRFRGRTSADNLAEHKRVLARELARRGMRPRGEALFAGYDPPSTLPLLRRTELWAELDAPARESKA